MSYPHNPTYDPGYPPEYDQDIIADTEKYLQEVEWQLMNWEERPGRWEKTIKDLIQLNRNCLDFITENI
jgi:hypothetical protein